MIVLHTQCLKGPNYWSNTRTHLVVLKIDIGEYEYLPSNKILNFPDSLKKLMPSLYEHRCSLGRKGGFFERLQEGTWVGHIIEHVALELQWLAGMECGFGRTYGTEKIGVYDVIFSYKYEQAGLYAAKAAVELVSALAQGKAYPLLEQDIAHLQSIAEQNQFGPSTQAIINEAQSRNIPIQRIANSLVTLGYGKKQKKIWASVTSNTSAIGMDIVADKELTKQILSTHFIPVPQGITTSNIEELNQAIATIGFPLVTKPRNGNHGRGITTDINTLEKLNVGFELAQKISPQVIVERFIRGDDYRILVVNYKVVAVAKRIPAHIIGNGIQSIKELIADINADPKRGTHHNNFLTRINIDSITLSILKEQDLTIDSVAALGKKVYLKDTANLSSGGTAHDMTDIIHPLNIRLAERIATLVGLDICGIDLIASDIQIPINQFNGAVLEVNAGPGLRMHLAPNEGVARNIGKPILDLLFPNQETGRIPLIGVTGTNGKTTVVTLLAKLAQQAGNHVGYTTTEGIYINEHLICEGDCSGPASAQIVLQSPDVDFAVLECARGGILRSGLGFDECDISITTNVTGDHLGLKEINTLEQLAQLKGVLARSTKKSGYALLNAEDDLTFSLKNDLTCNIGLFGREKNSRIIEHCAQGGLAIYIESDMLIIQWDSFIQKVIPITAIPLSYKGAASAMILNILPVVLAAFISKISLETIKEFLKNLKPNPETIPGRMNLFHFNNYKIMLDYAHNEGAYKELKNYISRLSFKKSIGIIGVAGDRRDEDIITVGRLAGELFDELVIRHDKDGRGRTNQQITELLLKGLDINKHQQVKIISDEIEAITYAVNKAQEQHFIFIAVENVFKSIKFLKRLQNKKVVLSSEESL